MIYEPHQLRVIKEQDELHEKLTKLWDFLNSDTYSNLDEGEKVRLSRQWRVMGQYDQVLRERINAFEVAA